MTVFQVYYIWPMDENKNILNDAAPEKVHSIYQPLITELKNKCLDNAKNRVHSLYLTGSVSRGRAIPGKSDLNTYAVLRKGDIGENLDWIEPLEQELKEKYRCVSDVELRFYPWRRVFPKKTGIFSDTAFNIKTHSICIYGDNLTAKIPNFQLSLAIANDFIIHAQSNIEEAIVDLKLDQSQDNLIFWCHKIIKNILRAGYALVMHKEDCFAWDLITCKTIFIKHYPEQVENINKGFYFLDNFPSYSEFVNYLNSFGKWIIEETNRWLNHYNPERLLAIS